MSCKCGKPVEYAGVGLDIVVPIKDLTPKTKTREIDSWLCEGCYSAEFKECVDCGETTDWWKELESGEILCIDCYGEIVEAESDKISGWFPGLIHLKGNGVL